MVIDDRPNTGLRERKKRKTRAAIQQHAMRLFREQGYHATTVDQIAEAAEISPSTFFRYFRAKEDVVLDDDYDPLLVEAFRDQPAGLSPVQAFRGAVASAFSLVSNEERETVLERVDLIFSVPELRAASLQQMTRTLQMIADLAADRLGLDRNDLYVLTFAGAVIGAIMAVHVRIAQNPGSDLAAIYDQALSYLEAGLPPPHSGS